MGMKAPFNWQQWVEAFWALPPVRAGVHWLQTHSLPGFAGVAIYDILVFIRNELKRQALIMRANAMAFSFFLSLFPSIITLFALIPYVRTYVLSFIPGGENYMEVLTREIHLVMPGSAGEMLVETIQDLTTRPRAGLFSLGFFLTLYFASNGMRTLLRSFEKSYDVTYIRRPVWQKELIALGLTFLMGLLLIASIVLAILGHTLVVWLAQYVKLDSFSTMALQLLRYITVVLFFYGGIALIYRYGPSVRQRFSFFSPGATLATLLSLLSSLAFSFYVDQFNTYNKLYGSIGTIIVVMLWIQINSFVLLIGYELNASIAVNRDLKALREEEE